MSEQEEFLARWTRLKQESRSESQPEPAEMPRVENMNFGTGHVVAISFGLAQIERQIIFPPQHQQPRLGLLHPRLPFGIGLDISAVVVEEIALNIRLSGLVKKRIFVGP